MAVGVKRKAVRRIVVDDKSCDGPAKAARGDDILVISCGKESLAKGQP